VTTLPATVARFRSWGDPISRDCLRQRQRPLHNWLEPNDLVVRNKGTKVDRAVASSTVICASIGQPADVDQDLDAGPGPPCQLQQEVGSAGDQAGSRPVLATAAGCVWTLAGIS
jgi:hypothetical protein